MVPVPSSSGRSITVDWCGSPKEKSSVVVILAVARRSMSFTRTPWYSASSRITSADAVGLELEAVVETELGRDDLADRGGDPLLLVADAAGREVSIWVMRRAEMAAVSIPPLRVILLAYSDAARRRRNPSTP